MDFFSIISDCIRDMFRRACAKSNNYEERIRWHVPVKKYHHEPVWVKPRYLRLFRGFLFAIGDK